MKNIFTLLFLIISIHSVAQFSTMFNDTLRPFGDGAYTFDGICQDDTFYYILGGVNNHEKNWQLMLTKIDKNGYILNKRKFGDSLIYYASYPYNSIIQKNNSILILSQTIDSLSVVKGCIMAIDKITLDTLWTKIYPHPDTTSIMSSADKFSDFTAIKATPDNGYILAGNYMSAGNLRSYLMKIDSVGNTLWTKTYNNYYTFFSIQVSSDSGYYIPCTYNGTSLKLLKVDKFGNHEWNVSLNSNTNPSYPMAVALQKNGNIAVTSAFWYDLTNNLRGITVTSVSPILKSIVWEKDYILFHDFIGITLHQAMGVETLSDGSIIVSGTLAKTGADLKGFIFKLNSNGDSLWTKTYDFGSPTQDDCQLNDLIVCDDGGFMGVGFFWSHLPNVNDAAWMFKTDANGTIGFEKTVAELVEAKVFPNPAADFINIELPENLPQNAEIKLYNSLGQMVLERQIAKGMQQVQINLKELERGIYFFELVNDELVIGNGKVVKE